MEWHEPASSEPTGQRGAQAERGISVKVKVLAEDLCPLCGAPGGRIV